MRCADRSWQRRPAQRLLLPIVVCAIATALAAAALAAPPPAQGAPQALNLPGRDATLTLTNAGRGQCSVYNYVSDGSKATRLRLWTGKVPFKNARLVAGDLNEDRFTDAVLLVKGNGKKCVVTVLLSTGKRMTVAAKWTGPLDWASARMVIGQFVPGLEADELAVMAREANGYGVSRFRLNGKKLVRVPLFAIPAAEAGAGALLAAGDVNGDFHDEFVVLSGSGSAARLAVYGTGTVGPAWLKDTEWTGSLPMKGAQLAVGDVDGDGVDEAVTLAGGTLTRFDCDAEQVATTAIAAKAIGLSGRCLMGVADLTGDARADIVALKRVAKPRSSLVVAVAQGAGFTPAKFWTGKTAYSSSRLSVNRTLAVRKRANVHVLPASVGPLILSIADDQSTITFDGAPVAVADLEKDDVIILNPCTQAPNGIMRKVVSVASADGDTVVLTSVARLQDVFYEVEIDVSAPASQTTGTKGKGTINSTSGRTRSTRRRKTTPACTRRSRATSISASTWTAGSASTSTGGTSSPPTSRWTAESRSSSTTGLTSPGTSIGRRSSPGGRSLRRRPSTPSSSRSSESPHGSRPT